MAVSPTIGKLTKLSHLQSGRLGEMLALAKLNSLGLPAYISPEGAPGHDLVVVIGSMAKSIEVKARQFLNSPTEITRWPVDLDKKGDADYFIFVEICLVNISPNFYLLTCSQAKSIHKVYSGLGNCPPASVRKLAQVNDFSILKSEITPLAASENFYIR